MGREKSLFEAVTESEEPALSPAPSLVGTTTGPVTYEAGLTPELEPPLLTPEIVRRAPGIGLRELASDVGYGLEKIGGARLGELPPAKGPVSTRYLPSEEIPREPDPFAQAGRETKEFWQEAAEAKRREISPRLREELAEPGITYPKAAWTIAESAPASLGMMAGGTGIAAGLIRAGISPAVAGIIGYGLAEGGQSALSSASDARDIIMDAPIEQLSQTPEFKEHYARTGDAEAAREAMALDAERKAAAITGPITAAAGAPFGGLVLGPIAGRVARGPVSGLVTGALSEAGQEAIQSPAEALAANVAARKAGYDVPLTAGMGEAAGMGAIAGGVMGGGVGIGGAMSRVADIADSGGLSVEEREFVRDAGAVPPEIEAKAPGLSQAVAEHSEEVEALGPIGMEEMPPAEEALPPIEAPTPTPPAERVFKKLIGKSGKTWLVDLTRPGRIYVESEEGDRGMYGNKVSFPTDTGETVTLEGPWSTNANALFADTGVDVREDVEQAPVGFEEMPPAEVILPPLPTREELAAPPAEQAPAPLTPIIGPETKVQATERWMFNYQNRLEDVENAIEKASGKRLPDDSRMSAVKGLAGSQTADEILQFRENMVKPAHRAIYDNGVDEETLRIYLIALHAPERNASIAEINPDKPDGGIGMMNAEAAQWLDYFDAEGLTPALERAAAPWRDMMNHKLEVQQRALLRTAEDVADMKRAWPNYIPAKHEAEDATFIPVGKRQPRGGVRGPGEIKALGRHDMPGDILAHIVDDVERSIARAKENETMQSLYKLLSENDIPEIGTVDPKVYKRQFNVRKGEVENVEKPDYKNAVPVSYGDHVKYIKITDQAYYDAITDNTADNQLRAIKGVGAVLGGTKAVQKFLTSMYTAYSLEFGVRNLKRDFQTGISYIAAEHGLKMAEYAARHTPQAIAGFWLETHGSTRGKWAQWSRRFKESGGPISPFAWSTPGYQTEQISKAALEHRQTVFSKAGNVLSLPFNEIENLNRSIENGVRLSAFRYLVEKLGRSDQEAAWYTKNLTVNFEQRGEIGSTLSTVYLFANPGLQGVYRHGQVWARHPAKMAAIGAAYGAVAYFLNNMNRMVSDDEPPEFVKDRNAVIKDMKGKGITTIPLPWMFNVYYAIGNALADIEHGRDKTEAALNVVVAVMDSFNPLGSEYSEDGVRMFLKNIMPNLLDPAVQIGLNETWYGTKLGKDQYPGGTVPDVERHWESVNPFIETIADTVYKWTGGKGDIDLDPWYSVDVNPEHIELMLQFLTGGIGALITNTAHVIDAKLKGEKVPAHKVPFKRIFRGEIVDGLGTGQAPPPLPPPPRLPAPP
jgi:hypothetical protein